MMSEWMINLSNAANIKSDEDANKFIEIITTLNDNFDVLSCAEFKDMVKLTQSEYIPVEALNKIIYDFEVLYNEIKSMPFQNDMDARMLCQLQRFIDHLKKGRNLLYEL